MHLGVHVTQMLALPNSLSKASMLIPPHSSTQSLAASHPSFVPCMSEDTSCADAAVHDFMTGLVVLSCTQYVLSPLKRL